MTYKALSIFWQLPEHHNGSLQIERTMPGL
jgi:hypothetical protein